MPTYHNKNSFHNVSWWVVFQLNPEKVIAKQRHTDPNKTEKIMEGSLDYVRRQIHKLEFYYRIISKPNPEKILELWY